MTGDGKVKMRFDFVSESKRISSWTNIEMVSEPQVPYLCVRFFRRSPILTKWKGFPQDWIKNYTTILRRMDGARIGDGRWSTIRKKV